MNETIPYLPGLSPVAGKALCARFDGGRLSSDGGVLVLRGTERRLGLADVLASCMSDAPFWKEKAGVSAAGFRALGNGGVTSVLFSDCSP